MINKNGLAPPERERMLEMTAPKGVNWPKLKREYITGTMSYAAIAEKYGISKKAVENHAKPQEWPRLRREYCDEVLAKATAAVADAQAQEEASVIIITNRLLRKIEETVDAIDPVVALADMGAYKDITVALKNIRDIRGERSERDIAEQEARIAKLRADAKKAEEDRAGAAAVEIVGLPEGYKG